MDVSWRTENTGYGSKQAVGDSSNAKAVHKKEELAFLRRAMVVSPRLCHLFVELQQVKFFSAQLRFGCQDRSMNGWNTSKKGKNSQHPSCTCQ